MMLKILTWNTLYAGCDGADDRRKQLQIKVISDIRPDVFLMQEAKDFDASGGTLLHDMEKRIGMRGFLAMAPRTGQNVAIFIRDPLRPLSFETDGANFHHALATLKVDIPGSAQSLTLISAHLSPNGPAVRRSEAAYLIAHAAPNAYALLTGDFNSASPHDPDPVGFDALPAHHRARYLAEDLNGIDRSVLANLEAAGWVDIGHKLDKAIIPTVPATAFADTEFATMRCDYVLATAVLAANAKHYEVIRTTETNTASDHYPIVTYFKL
ncbi:endonuclease/exonuclease/phosphatase family protein [Ochrobactrum sp. BD22]